MTDSSGNSGSQLCSSYSGSWTTYSPSNCSGSGFSSAFGPPPSIDTNEASITGDVTTTIDDNMRNTIETTIRNLLVTKLQLSNSGSLILKTEVRINEDGTNTFIVEIKISTSVVSEQAFNSAIKSINKGEVTASLQSQGVPAKDASIQNENPANFSVKLFVSLAMLFLVLIV